MLPQNPWMDLFLELGLLDLNRERIQKDLGWFWFGLAHFCGSIHAAEHPDDKRSPTRTNIFIPSTTS